MAFVRQGPVHVSKLTHSQALSSVFPADFLDWAVRIVGQLFQLQRAVFMESALIGPGLTTAKAK
jgi:hypothetical protein